MIKTVYNQNEDSARLDELNFIRAQSSAVSKEDQRLSNTMRNYAIIQRQQNGQADDALERMLESVRNCEGQDYANFVKEHAASVVRAVQAQNASEQNKRGDFMKHFKLVNRIGGRELE